MKFKKRDTVTKQGAMLLLQMIVEDVINLKYEVPDPIENFIDDTLCSVNEIAKYIDKYGDDCQCNDSQNKVHGVV